MPINKDVIFTFVIGSIIGIIIFSILPNSCENHGPNSKNIVKKVYEYEDKLYKFKPVVTICPGSISMNQK